MPLHYYKLTLRSTEQVLKQVFLNLTSAQSLLGKGVLPAGPPTADQLLPRRRFVTEGEYKHQAFVLKNKS